MLIVAMENLQPSILSNRPKGKPNKALQLLTAINRHMIRILKQLNWHVHCLFLIFDQHFKNCTELNFTLTLPPRMSRKPSAFFFTIQTLAPFYFTCFKWVLFSSKKRRQWEVTLSVFQILLLTTISKIYLKWRTVLTATKHDKSWRGTLGVKVLQI